MRQSTLRAHSDNRPCQIKIDDENEASDLTRLYQQTLTIMVAVG
jgi:hypothetical protein